MQQVRALEKAAEKHGGCQELDRAIKSFVHQLDSVAVSPSDVRDDGGERCDSQNRHGPEGCLRQDGGLGKTSVGEILEESEDEGLGFRECRHSSWEILEESEDEGRVPTQFVRRVGLGGVPGDLAGNSEGVGSRGEDGREVEVVADGNDEKGQGGGMFFAR